MRLNKTVKALAVALPIFTLAACSSTDEEATSEAQINAEQQAAEKRAAEAAAEQARAEAVRAEQEFQEKEEQRKVQELMTKHIIYFDFDKSTVSADFSNLLDMHAEYLKANSDKTITIEGHADERGTPEYNIALGERRAKAVATYLETMGVSSSQFSIVSYGEEKPMVTDRTESAFAQNRRAVLVY